MYFLSGKHGQQYPSIGLLKQLSKYKILINIVIQSWFSSFLQVTFNDDGNILFPSITFCKTYMYDDSEGIFKNQKQYEFPNKKMFQDTTWSRDKLFLTVSHNTVDGSYNFPCTTVGGPQMGSPCSFPFVYPDCLGGFKPLHW